DSTLDQAIAKIQAATRSYAKRQVTWCRHQMTAPIWLDSENAADNLARLIALDESGK
ncbi:MAG: hypothetical protein ORN98_05615, partial [Alphaproteobacteria bacterium]|nr:hypothetical protein [Alphaproteobacteria bacterium]